MHNLIALVFLLLLFASALIAWDTRPFERLNWQTALLELEAAGKCKRVRDLVLEAATAGDPDAYLHMVRLNNSATFQNTCPKIGHITTERWREHLPVWNPDLSFLQNTEQFKEALMARHVYEQSAEARQLKRIWSLSHGWRPAFAFEFAHAADPTLGLRRALIWLRCSRQDLLSVPINHAHLNRAVRLIAHPRTPAQPSRLEQRQIWCRESLYDLARSAGQEKSADAKETWHLAFDFGDPKMERAFYDLIHRVSGEPDDQITNNMAALARSGHAGSQRQMAERFANGTDRQGVMTYEGRFWSAFWGSVAQRSGADTQELTRSAINELKPKHRADLEKILACWELYHYSKGDRLRYGPNLHRSLDEIIERIVDDCE